MDMIGDLLNKVAGPEVSNLINQQVTPILLSTLKPNVNEYVGQHVQRSRNELHNQLPDNIQRVLQDLTPESGGNTNRGFLEDLAGPLENMIRTKLGEIIGEIQEKVRTLVDSVTDGTTNRVTDGVIEIAKRSLEIKSREINSNVNSGNNSRAVGNSDGSGDFVDNFVSKSVENCRPLVKQELEKIYELVVQTVPQDARRVLDKFMDRDPNVDYSSSGNNQGNFNPPPQHYDQQNFNQGQQNYNQNQNFNQGQQNFNNPQGDFNQGQNFNQDQNFNQQNFNQNQQNFNQNQQNYNQQNFNQNQPNYDQQNFNQNQYEGSRGMDGGEVRDRGFMSDLMNVGQKLVNKVEQKIQSNPILSGKGGEFLEEFFNRVKDKVNRITAELMQTLENNIMGTVSKELSGVAKNKLQGLIGGRN